MSVNVSLVAEYSQIFPKGSDSIEELSKGISKLIFFQAGTTFLAKQTIDQDAGVLLEEVQLWFNDRNQEYKYNFIKTILEKYGNESKNLILLNAVASLKLLQIGFEISAEHSTKSEEQIEIDILKIYLLINEQVYGSHGNSSEYIKEHYPDLHPELLLLTMGFSTSDLTNFIYGREYFSQTVKSLFLFSFLKKSKILEAHIDAFKVKYEVRELEDYYSRAFGLIKSIVQKEEKGFLELNCATQEDLTFVEKLTVGEYLKSDDLDFRMVRSSPLIKTDSNRFRVSHPLFFTDKLFKGLYFEFSRINSTLDRDKKIKEFRSFYTTNFSERYLLYRVMEYCLKGRYFSKNGDELDQQGISGAPDYYIRNGKYVMLIENKDVLINAAVKENPDFASLEAELKKKFLNKGNAKVGIAQIVDNIERLLQKQNTFDTDYNEKNVVVYPVLLLHDIAFDCPALNQLFQVWFNQLMNGLGAKGIDTSNVKPLCVLNIDTVIRCAEILRLGRMSFFELVEIYYSTIRKTKKKFNSEKEFQDFVTEKSLPSTKIIENWLNENRHMLPESNKILDFAFKINLAS